MAGACKGEGEGRPFEVYQHMFQEQWPSSLLPIPHPHVQKKKKKKPKKQKNKTQKTKNKTALNFPGKEGTMNGFWYGIIQSEGCFGKINTAETGRVETEGGEVN